MTPRLSLEELVDRSELIIHGRCLRSWSAWDAGHQFIWTHHEIQVSDPLKGAPGLTVVVSEPGGILDGMELLIEGLPRYQDGEEMVLFLFKTPIGFWRTRGLGQGKYGVVADAAAGQRLRADLNGAVLIEPAGAATAKGTDLQRLNGVRLQEFKSMVRGLAARPVKGAK